MRPRIVETNADNGVHVLLCMQHRLATEQNSPCAKGCRWSSSWAAGGVEVAKGALNGLPAGELRLPTEAEWAAGRRTDRPGAIDNVFAEALSRTPARTRGPMVGLMSRLNKQ